MTLNPHSTTASRGAAAAAKGRVILETAMSATRKNSSGP